MKKKTEKAEEKVRTKPVSDHRAHMCVYLCTTAGMNGWELVADCGSDHTCSNNPNGVQSGAVGDIYVSACSPDPMGTHYLKLTDPDIIRPVSTQM